MTDITFTVLGEPKGKARARTTKYGTYTPEKTVLYENLIKTEYLRQCGNKKIKANIPIAINISASFGIPKSFSKAKTLKAMKDEILPTKKPDLDNIAKVVCDALNGIAYHDDSQIVRLYMMKTYGFIPQIVVRIWEC